MRALLRLAWDAERTSSEVPEAAGLSRSAASQHPRVLRQTGLVHVRADANRRLYRVGPERLATVRAFLDDFWGAHLGSLERTAETLRRTGRGALGHRPDLASRHPTSRCRQRSPGAM